MADTKTYEIHPACAKWPHTELDFAMLVADVRKRGLINPIWLTPTNEILDGKLRYEACREAGVEPRFDLYSGDDPIGFTISQNKMRRHMSASQLALIGEELANLQHGTNQYQKKVGALASTSISERDTQARIAQQLGISRELLGDARALKKHAESNVIELVEAGQVGIKNAAAYARHTSREDQRNADKRTVRQQGGQMRAPIKNGIRSKRLSKSNPSKKVSKLRFSPEQARELNEKLRPLIKRLRVQSKKHIVEFSPFELECIAFEIDKLLASWTNTETDMGRQAPTASDRQVSGNLEN
jgi:ParB-like chromosome segregation protein Spo0J